MTLLDYDDQPSDLMRRWFGLSLAILMFVVAFLIKDAAASVSMLVAAFGVIVVLAYYMIPSSQQRIIRYWRRLTFPIAWVGSHLLLGIVFYGVVCPIGIALRVLGHDPLGLRKESLSSNWISRRECEDVSKYFNQF